MANINHHYPCDLCSQPTGDDANTCTPCASKAATALRQIHEWLADDLTTAMARQTALTEPNGGKTPRHTQPLPINLKASEALSVLHNTLATWTRILTDNNTTRPQSTTTKDLAAWLAPVITWARTRPYGAELVDEILAAHQQAMHAIDHPTQLTYAGRCTTCTAPIYALGTHQTAHCQTPGCDGHITNVTAARLDLLRRAPDHLVTATTAARALSTAGHPVTSRWVRHLAQQGHIPQVGNTHPARYRIGDIMDVLAPKETAA